MENNSEHREEPMRLNDTNNHAKNKENSLRLRLVHAFSSGGLKSPKSVSSSGSSSPGYNSPCVKKRYSWHLPLPNKECHTPCSSGSGVSRSPSKSFINKSSTNSPINSFPPQSPTYAATWYANESDEVLAAAAAKGKEVGERRLLDRRYTESWRTTSLNINGGQEFVEFLDEEPDLSFTVYGDVRLDARVPARFDASSGRLLESGVQSERLVPQFIDVFNELKLRDRVHV